MTEEASKTSSKTNGYDPEVLRSVVEDIEGCMSDLASEKGAYMNRCRGIREGISAAYDRAKENGIKRKELKTLVKNREAQRKIEEREAALEDDERDAYTKMKESLGAFGDTPLGTAALDRARPKGETLDSLHS